jgi:nitrite reductase (NADH) small subunit
MSFTPVAAVQEVPPGKAKQIKVNGRTLALFNVSGTFHAIDDTCPHRGAPLWEGDLAGNEVTCPWHGACFNVTSGVHLSPPAQSDVIAYKVQVVGDQVQVDVP